MMISAFTGLHRQQRLDMQKVVIMLRTGSLIVVRHNVDILRTWSGAFEGHGCRLSVLVVDWVARGMSRSAPFGFGGDM